ncbi:iron(III) transport system permease protein [Rhodoferax sp. OV413]|uniref:ABC transporter permease n=1 Tax=Rhodoferax sp. OV413 TaxID=1855285 RepID=UPI00088038BE|nr:iron ABC transporter permease [Rhodoferax sp. OV413]SDP89914.1 iron(III) transport system permease protein [Rhodoferax sp. OV413]
MNKSLRGWLMLALTASVLLPWHAQEAGFWGGEWLHAGWPGNDTTAAALWQVLGLQRFGLLPLLLWPVAVGLVCLAPLPRRTQGAALCGLALAALGWLAWLGWGPAGTGLPGLGWGALLFSASAVFVLTTGAAWMGACRGDVFVCGVIGMLVALVGLFVMFPVLRVLASAFEQGTGFSLQAAWARVADGRIWSLGCISGTRRCGVAWNTMFLALCTAAGATLLGLCFALVVTRTSFRFKRILRALTVLPIITPPFVIGLALILLFGRSGVVSAWVSQAFDVPAGRGLYGFYGVWLAQLLSFTPIAFMVLIGVVEGVSPSVEEASQTLGGDRWTTFWRVSLPLMRPGLANAFLVAFIESMADFGNPMVLGGNYGVLSTEIYFAIVGAQNDGGRAAGLGLILLVFAVSAFLAQRHWLGNKSYTTVTGKADNGQHVGLDRRLSAVLAVIATLWTSFTLVLYGMILAGGFVNQWGRDNSFTLRHYASAFGIEAGEHGLRWVGTAWDSLFTSLMIAGVSAPLTAALGLTAAWLLVRQRFAGKAAFEFATMLSFAIPGTVIGISYILAFNMPPIELTGTAAILVLCFVFRNMPVGLRGGMAAMSQLDRSLDEASTMLGANSFTTARRVILPLMRPALSAALVYSFVRSITSISAVVFLVSAKYNMATAYIVGLVENGSYGIAIAYSSALIVVMLVIVLAAQSLVGKRRLRRVERVEGAAPAPVFSLKVES